MIIKITRISPSIIASPNYNNDKTLDETIVALEKSGASMLHLDVMDGKFVKNKTFDHSFVDKIKGKTSLLLDAHLMVENPTIEVVDKYIKAGADIISVHYETCKNLKAVLEHIKSKNVIAGVAISPGTPAIKLNELLKSNLCDMVLVMCVEPGEYGQTFIAGMAEKVAEVREMSRNVFIEVDGGVNLKNAKMLRKLGANILVSGSTIFHSKNMKKTIRALKGHNYLTRLRELVD